MTDTPDTPQSGSQVELTPEQIKWAQLVLVVLGGTPESATAEPVSAKALEAARQAAAKAKARAEQAAVAAAKLLGANGDAETAELRTIAGSLAEVAKSDNAEGILNLARKAEARVMEILTAAQEKAKRLAEEARLREEEEKRRQEKETALKASKTWLATRRGSVERMKNEATQALGTLPADVARLFESVAQTLATADSSTEPEEIDKAIEDTDDPLGEIETRVEKLTQERAAYKPRLDLAEQLLAGLAVHACKDAFATEIDVQKEAVRKARDETAGAHRYADAVTALNTAIRALEQIEKDADAKAKYDIVLADRQGRVNALPANSTEVPVDTELTKIRQDLQKAETHGTGKEYAKATAILDTLPKRCIDLNWTAEKAKDYGWKYAARGNHLTELTTLVEPDYPEVRPMLTRFREIYNQASYATTGDYVDSLRRLDTTYYLKGEIEKAVEAVKNVRAKLKELADEIPLLKALDGADGIVEDIAKQQAEHDYAKDKIPKGEFVGATKLIDAAKALWPAIREKAAAYKKFQDLHDKIDGEYQIIAALPGAPGAGAELDPIRDGLASAKTTAKGGKAAEASEALLALRPLLPEARYAALRAHAVDGVGRPPEDPTATDQSKVGPRLGIFDGIYNPVNGHGKKTYAGPVLGEAGTLRGEAVTARDLNTNEGFATAVTKLNAGIDKALEAQRNLDRALKFLETRTELLAELGAIADPDNAVKVERQEAQTAIQAGNSAIGSQDWGTAGPQFSTALAALKKAKRLLEIYNKYKALLPTVNTLVTEVDTTDGRAALPTLVPALKTDFTTAKEHAKIPDNRRYQEALDGLKDVQKRVPPLKAIMGDYGDAKNYRSWWARPSNLDEFRGKPIVATELAEMEALVTAVDEKFTARLYASVKELAVKVMLMKDPTKAVLDAHKAYTDALGKAEPEVLKLDTAKNAAVTEELAACVEAVRRAKEIVATCAGPDAKKLLMSKMMALDEAKKLVEPLPGRIAEALKVADAYDRYETARAAAETAIGEVKGHAHAETVAGRIAAAETEYRTATGLAGGKDYLAALRILEPLPDACKAAKDHAEAHGEFATAMGGEHAKALDTADKTGLGEEVQAARTLLGKLRSHASAALLKDRLDAIETAIGTAETAVGEEKLGEAREGLKDVFFRLGYAHTVADQHLHFKGLLEEARTALAEVRKHPQAAVVEAGLKTLDFELGLAEENGKQELFQSAIPAAQAASETCVTALASCYAHVDFLAARKPLSDRIDTLAGHAHKYAVDAQLKEARGLLGEANAKATALDHAAAGKLLKTLADLLQVAELKAAMATNAEPDEAALKKLLERPDGPQALDAIVQGLDPVTTRKVVHKAFKLRFDVDLQMLTTAGAAENLPNEKAPNIRKLFEIFAAVPDKYTRDNPSMKIVKRQGDTVDTSSYNPSDKALKLMIGRAEDKNEKALADPIELPNIEPALRPVGEAAPKFNWTTLHEIAHSIDDRTSYMSGNGAAVDHGGWKEHGSNLSDIAQAAATEFDYDANYIEAYLRAGAGSDSYPVPKPQRGIDADQWERNRVEAVVWCDAIRKSNNIWYNDAECAKRQIGGRVYQESYPNDWTSYLYSARSKGVTGYQFRAPGEWFSEVYAAYHTGRLPNSHPAIDILKKFGEPKK